MRKRFNKGKLVGLLFTVVGAAIMYFVDDYNQETYIKESVEEYLTQTRQ